MKQVVEGMQGDALFAAVSPVSVDMQRQAGDGLGQDTHTGIDCCGLHRSSLVDRLSAGCASEQERPSAADSVLGLVAGVKKAG